MHSKMLKTIRKYNMLNENDHIIVGLSGGADSVSLLYLLLKIRTVYRLGMTAIHINHGIRADEAVGDQLFSAELCRKLGVPFQTIQADVPNAAKSLGISEEEAGRRIRYREFERLREELKAQKIAVAHNMDDNAETVIFNICRGAGLKGICGIPAVRGNVIRPLIEISRTEIESFLSENNIQYKTDSTNGADHYTRNRIRHKILPELKSFVNENAAETISRAASVLVAENDYIEHQTREAYKDCVSKDAEINISMDRLDKYHDAVKNRILRLAVSELRPDLRDISFANTLNVLSLFKSETGKTVELPGNIKARRNYGCITVYRDGGSSNFEYRLNIGERVYLPQQNRYISVSDVKLEKNNIRTKEVDYDKIKNGVTVRTRKPGDKIAIKGVGTKKIKDYFIDKKIPRAQREQTALAADENSVICILDEAFILNCEYEPAEKTCYIQIWEEKHDGNS